MDEDKLMLKQTEWRLRASYCFSLYTSRCW